MNEPNVPHAKITCNPGDPLRAAQLHNFALRLDLCLVRRDLAGPQKVAVINRLLDVNAALARSLEWLRAAGSPGLAGAANDGFVELAHLATERQGIPSGTEAMQ